MKKINIRNDGLGVQPGLIDIEEFVVLQESFQLIFLFMKQ